MFHRDEVVTVALAGVVDDRDIGMCERRGGLRLLYESAHSIGVAAGRWQQLQRDPPMQPCIVCEKNLAHATGTERRQHLIPAEGAPWSERHGLSVHYRSYARRPFALIIDAEQPVATRSPL